MKAIHELIAFFTAKGWLSNEQQQILFQKGVWSLVDPGNLEGYCDRIGETFYFETRGRTTGSLWGDGIYTSDSDLGTAAVHAGVLAMDRSGIVKVTIVPSLVKFTGSMKNGVQSRLWTTGWRGAYTIARVS